MHDNTKIIVGLLILVGLFRLFGTGRLTGAYKAVWGNVPKSGSNTTTK